LSALGKAAQLRSEHNNRQQIQRVKGSFFALSLGFFYRKVYKYRSRSLFFAKKGKKAAFFPYCFAKQYLLLVRKKRARYSPHRAQKL
jgi:hypothetical protein